MRRDHLRADDVIALGRVWLYVKLLACFVKETLDITFDHGICQRRCLVERIHALALCDKIGQGIARTQQGAALVGHDSMNVCEHLRSARQLRRVLEIEHLPAHVLHDKHSARRVPTRVIGIKRLGSASAGRKLLKHRVLVAHLIDQFQLTDVVKAQDIALARCRVRKPVVGVVLALRKRGGC